MFKEKDINILECRAIDSVYKEQGKVELIATINNDFSNGRSISFLQGELNKFYKKKLGISPTKRMPKPITLKKPIDKNFVNLYNASSQNDKDENTITLNVGHFAESFPIELPNTILSETIKDKKPFSESHMFLREIISW